LLTDNDSSSKISKNSNKRKGKAKAKEESLMDHYKKIENNDVVATIETDSDTEESIYQIKNIDDMPMSNEALISEADRIAKENLLNSSDSNGKQFILIEVELLYMRLSSNIKHSKYMIQFPFD